MEATAHSHPMETAVEATAQADDQDGVELIDDDDKGLHLLVHRGYLGDESGALERMAWTADGQILTVGSDSGTVYNFLACLPVLSAACGSRCAAAQSAPFRPACECA